MARGGNKFHDDVCEVPTPKKLIVKLEKITELRILDLQGNHVLSFWKGDKANEAIQA